MKNYFMLSQGVNVKPFIKSDLKTCSKFLVLFNILRSCFEADSDGCYEDRMLAVL